MPIRSIAARPSSLLSSFRVARFWPVLLSAALAACGSSARNGSRFAEADMGFSFGGPDGGPDLAVCNSTCSPDYTQVIDCAGNVLSACSETQTCDPIRAACADLCDQATQNRGSLGCDYYATYMDTFNATSCFAVFVANTSPMAAHLTVTYKGKPLDLTSFARTPQGTGPTLTYQPFNPQKGVQPNQVVLLFLSGPSSNDPQPGDASCPVPSAVPNGVLSNATGIFDSFHIVSDVPVVAYQINPYGGGRAAVTGASLLLPTSVWDTDYVAVSITPYDIANPSMNIVAMQDDTEVTITPVAAIAGGGGVPSGAARSKVTFTLAQGQNAQLSQMDDLTGSVVSATKPIGFMAGQNCMREPAGTAYCDHGEQMVPPVKALGNEYVGVMYRPRVQAETKTVFRVIGVVPGTQLTWSPSVGGPTTLSAGQVVEWQTGTPFDVKSQDLDHPFMLFMDMTGSQYVSDGYGDPDSVLGVPPQQFLDHYIIFADPTYPETDLVIVRRKGDDMQFHDVTLDCAGVLGGWKPVGDYEWTRADLITGNFQSVGNCSTGRHEIKSDAPFGVWVWGWGTPDTNTQNVSYGYPGGMDVQLINTVVPTIQ